MSKFLARAWSVPMRRKVVFVEALGSTAIAWIRVKLVPYAAWRSKLGQPLPLASLDVNSSPARRSGDVVLQDIAWAHRWLARLFPHDFTCLMIAMSARDMLKRRKRPSVLILGARRSRDTAAKGLAAHAWVLSRGVEIVGGDSREGHTPVMAYSDGDTSVAL